MTYWERIELRLTSEEIKEVRRLHKPLSDHFEYRYPLTYSQFQELATYLGKVLEKQSGFRETLQKCQNGGDQYVLHLQHPDNFLLNLPWASAQMQGQVTRLGQTPRLHLIKSLQEKWNTHAFDNPEPGPLKILVMIAAPEDLDHKHLLSYEKEDQLLQQAFLPLLQSGQVEIDYTHVGSLDSLREKLNQNFYHILHFSGHGVYRSGKGFLQLEDPFSLKTHHCPAVEFAEVLIEIPEHCPSLVVLSSCQTAQGGNQGAEAVGQQLSGVSNQLIRIGIPAVVAMSHSILDHYAMVFSQLLYSHLSQRISLLSAYSKARNELQAYEENFQQRQNDRRPANQWTLPQLYLSRPVEHLVSWQRQEKPLKLKPGRYLLRNAIAGKLQTREGDVFIGRRRETAQALTFLSENESIQLKGQGGVGKTALAEHLVHRMIRKGFPNGPLLF